MSAILDLLTRRVEEKGVSKMILDIKEEMEKQQRIEDKFNELIKYYTLREAYAFRNDFRQRTCYVNTYKTILTDFVKNVDTFIDWNAIVFHMGEDILEISPEVIEKLYLGSLIHMNESLSFKQGRTEWVEEHGIMTSIDFKGMIERVGDMDDHEWKFDILDMKDFGFKHQ